MILTKFQADVCAALAATYGNAVSVEDTNIQDAICATPGTMFGGYPGSRVRGFTRSRDVDYQYIIGKDSVLRVGGDDGMVSVDPTSFHMLGTDWSTDGCHCKDAEGETCPRHGSPGDEW